MQKITLDMPDQLHSGLVSEVRHLGMPIDQLIGMALWAWLEKQTTQRSFTQPIKSAEQALVLTDESDTMYTEEAAAFLRMDIGMLYKMTREKKIPHERYGRRIIYSRSTLLEWKKDNRENSTKIESDTNSKYPHLTLAR